ncbi:MAG: hypothetical protein SynsKO_21680 [Synoicihabitans sp.]
MEGAWDHMNPLTVPQGGLVMVSGWAGDTVTGSSGIVANVHLNGSSTPIVQIPMEDPRGDVAAIYGSGFANSGFSGSFSTAGYAVGSTVTVSIWVGSSSAGWKLLSQADQENTAEFTVTAPNSPPTGTVSGDEYSISTWGGSYTFNEGSDVDNHSWNVVRNGALLGGGFFPEQHNIMWGYGSGSGTYKFAVNMSGSGGGAQTNEVTTVVDPPVIHVDQTNGTPLDQGFTFVKGAVNTASGWAFDYQNGAPIDVSFVLDGVESIDFYDAITNDQTRDDVETASTADGGDWSPGNDITQSGWSSSFDARTITHGSHTLNFRATNSFGFITDSATYNFDAGSAQSLVSSNDQTIELGSSWSPSYSGGSGTGAYQFAIESHTNWPRNGATGTANTDDTNIQSSWTPTTAGTFIFYVRKIGDNNYGRSNHAGPYELEVVSATDPSTFDASVVSPYAPGVVSLTWTTDGATSVSVTDSSSTVLSTSPNGSTSVTGLANGPHTFQLTVVKPLGSQTISRTIFIGDTQQGSILLSASPDVIQTGQSTTLDWSVENGSTVTLTGPNLGSPSISVAPQGSMGVSGLGIGNHTYTLSADINGVTVSDSKVVSVYDSVVGSGASPGSISPSGTLVGELGGSLAVDNRGSANYTIPLTIPTGRSGYQPPLAVSYNSQSGNGVMGRGFSISAGQSVITRGRSIYSRDQERRNVELSDNDKLYLDGKRLVLVGDGTYLKDGSEYRTEVETFAKITAHGSANSAADAKYFKVQMKDGRVMYYGEYSPPSNSTPADDAYQKLGGENEDKAHTYALKRVVWPTNHYITYHYDEVGMNFGEHVLTSIRYTGRSDSGPHAEVQFYYNYYTVSGDDDGDSMRDDARFGYLAGRSIPSTQRLDTIIARVGQKDSHRYDFEYEYAPETNSALFSSAVTRLTKVKGYAKASLDDSDWEAIPATSFTWSDYDLNDRVPQNEAASFSSMPGGALPAMDPSTPQLQKFADVDGDGLTDLVYWQGGVNGPIKVRLSNGSGFSAATTWLNGGLIYPDYADFADFDGDGRADIIDAGPNNHTVKVAYSNGTKFTNANNIENQVTSVTSITEDIFQDYDSAGDPTYHARDVYPASNRSRLTTADFTGDGRADILLHGFDGRLQVLVSQGRTFDSPSVWNPQVNPARVFLASSPDPLYFLSLYHVKIAPDLWDSSWATYNSAYILDDHFSILPKLGDYNGDGLIDYAWVESSVRTWFRNQWVGAGGTAATIRQKFYISLSKPEGGFENETRVFDNWPSAEPTFSEAGNRLLTGDFNGDGITDVLYRNAGGSAGRNWDLRKYKGDGSFDLETDPFNLVGDPHHTGPGENFDPGYEAITQGYWNDFLAPYDWLDDNPASGATELDGANYLHHAELTPKHTWVLDLNEDGMEDILWVDGPEDGLGAASAKWKVCLANGRGFDAPVEVMGYNDGALSSLSDYAFTAALGDDIGFSLNLIPARLNTDGRTDWILSSPQAGERIFVLSDEVSGDLVTDVTSGLGRTTKIAYDSILRDEIYTSGASVVYPIQERRRAPLVVSDVWHDTGLEAVADNHFSYQYSGRRIDLSGRGSLGFHGFVTLDNDTNLFKYQFLTQSFPSTGLTAREQTYRYWTDANGENPKFRLLSSQDNRVVFAKIAPYDTTLYPFISQSTEQRWENSTTPHFPDGSGTVPSMGPSSAPEYLFSETRPNGHHIKITATSYFDGQSSSQDSNAGLGSSYFPSDNNGPTTNVVSSAENYLTIFNSLTSSLTHGNLTKLVTEYGETSGEKYTETVETSYHGAPAGLPMMSGRPEVIKTSVTSPNSGYTANNAPDKVYTYQDGTSLVISEELRDPGSSEDYLTTTHIRDDHGRITQTSLSGTEIGSYTSYKVRDASSGFDPVFGLPITTENAYQHPTTTSYHSWSAQPTSVNPHGWDASSDSITAGSGYVISTGYDALGRVTSVTDSRITDGGGTPVPTTTIYSDVNSSVDDVVHGGITIKPKFQSTTSAAHLPTSVTYFDRLSRPIRVSKDGYGAGQTIVSDTVFNRLGQVVAVSNPAFGSAAHWTETFYDKLGRVESVSAPTSLGVDKETVTQYSYAGRTTTVSVTAHGKTAQKTKTEVNTRGETIKIWNPDPASGEPSSTLSLEFILDGFGRMRETLLEGNSDYKVTATYNDRGHQTHLNDPDKGAWDYQHDELGRVIWQGDANQTTTDFEFDHLGRPLKRTTKFGGAAPTEEATWHYFEDSAYGTAHNGHRANPSDNGWLGALQCEKVTTTGNPGFGDYRSAKSYTYDSRGFPKITLHNLNDDPSTDGGKFFYTDAGYDSFGRPHTMDYFWRPKGQEYPVGDTTGGTWHSYGIVNSYSAHSYLEEITTTDIDSAGNPAPKTWWKVGASGYDALDRPVAVRKGNALWTQRTYHPADNLLTHIKTGSSLGNSSVQNHNYGYDGLGNLTSRQRQNTSPETYTYDNLNRLKQPGGIVYESNGNITSKPSVGGTVSITAYHDDHPHAVRTYNYDSQTYTIEYDANGNLTQRHIPSGDPEDPTVTHHAKWTGFDKPHWLAKGTVGSEFLYGADRQRVAHLRFDAMSGDDPSNYAPSNYTRKKIYVGSGMEVDYKQVTSGGALEMDRVRIYISAPDGNVGSMDFAAETTAATEHKALVYHYDHLGSIDLITDYGDTNGNPSKDWSVPTGSPPESLDAEYSYTAWGERRDPVDLAGAPETTTHGGEHDLTPRGFTGHEMMDEIDLIHMNGRIYDPLLGRLLSADKYIQAPGNLQSYNRYSYVMNNPLTMTDPTGYFWDPDSGFWGAAEWGTFGKAAVVDPAVEGFESGSLHMEKGFTEIANAESGLDVTIGVLEVIAGVGEGVGIVADFAPGGKQINATAGALAKHADELGDAASRATKALSGRADDAAGGASQAQRRLDGAATKTDEGTKAGRLDTQNVSASEANKTLTQNKAAGKDWEKKVDASPAPGHQTAEQVTMVVDTPNGPVRVRADQLIKNEQTGKFTLVESKSSATAQMTKNQSQALPALQNGATAEIRGKKGAAVGLNAGDQITVDNVLLVRPTGVSTP